MEMRLGKTMLTIRWATTRPRVERILVTCPMGAVRSWRDELAEEGQPEPGLLLGSANDRLDGFDKNRLWHIINFEGLLKPGHKTKGGKTKVTPSEWALIPWDVVIVDESPRIRSVRAQITKIFLQEMALAPYKALLTGLPAPEGPEGYVTQMLFLRGEFMGCSNFYQWRRRHMNQLPMGAWIMKNKSVPRVRAEIHKHCFVMSRKDAGLGNVFVHRKRHVQLPAKTMAALKELEEELEVAGRITKNVLTVMIWAAQIAGGTFKGLEHSAKVNELLYLLGGELRQEQVVVWARFTAELWKIRAALVKAGITHQVVTGGKGRVGNDQAIIDFKMGQARVLVAQPKCIQMGVDLSCSSTLIYYSNYFDYEIRAQTRDRIEHMMKKEAMLVIDLVAEGTIDEDIVESLKHKRANAQTILRRFLSRRRAA